MNRAFSGLSAGVIDRSQPWALKPAVTFYFIQGITMKYLILASLLVLSIACNKDKDKGDKDKGKAQDVDAKVTDLSVCQGPVAANASITANQWINTEMVQTDVKVSSRLIVTATNVTVVVTCSSGDSFAESTVAVKASVDAGRVYILSSAEQSNEFTVGKDKYSCGTSLKEGSQIPYTFQGPCLSVGTGNGKLLFTKAQ